MKRRLTMLCGAIAAFGLVATATVQAGGEDSTPDTSGGGEEDLTFFVITHGDDGPFWTVAQNGAEDAGRDLGVTVVYQGSNNDPQAQAQMIEAAITEEADGIAVSLPNPDAVSDAVAAAIEAGIPVYSLNSGLNAYQEMGIVTHVGQTELVAGAGAGQRFNDAGMQHVMCVIHEQGNIALEERCDGLEEGFDGDVTRLQVTGDADPTTSQQETVAALQADESIDAILAAGPVQAIVAVEAVDEVGREIMIGNFDMSGDVIDAIENGDISFAIDQQQYLQGYLPVVFMYLQATNLNTVGGGQPILTGPGFVTQENAAEVRELAEAGTR